MPLLNPCLDCGDLAAATRCPDCESEHRRARARRRPSTAARGYGSAHQRIGGRAIRGAKICARCGGGPRRDDPFTRGHLVPVSRGGTHRDGYQPEHRSCNAAAGNRG